MASTDVYVILADIKANCHSMVAFSFFRINVADNSLDISYEEWRDYLLFHPSAELNDIINSWRHNTVRLPFKC